MLSSMAFVLCIPFAHAAGKQIQLSVNNKTGQDLVIAAQYNKKTQDDQKNQTGLGLTQQTVAPIGMANPFEYVPALKGVTTPAKFDSGKLEEVVVRTRNQDGPLDIITLRGELLSKTGLTVTIDEKNGKFSVTID